MNHDDTLIPSRFEQRQSLYIDEEIIKIPYFTFRQMRSIDAFGEHCWPSHVEVTLIRGSFAYEDAVFLSSALCNASKICIFGSKTPLFSLRVE